MASACAQAPGTRFSRCGPGNGNLFNEDTKQQNVLHASRCRIGFRLRLVLIALNNLI